MGELSLAVFRPLRAKRAHMRMTCVARHLHVERREASCWLAGRTRDGRTVIWVPSW